MELIFDLNSSLRFDNFQTLSMNLNKNSPSAAVIRGKGTLHSAENFVFSDKLELSFTLSEDELVKMYNVYAMYRSKGMVFISSKELFNKLFPNIEQQKIETLKTVFYEDIEDLRSSNSYDSTEKNSKLREIATFLIKYRMVNTYAELKNYFSVEAFITESFFNETLASFGNFTFDIDRPFLTMLHSMSVRSIVSTSNGYQVTLSLAILDEIIDEATEKRYRSANRGFTTYYEKISNKIDSLMESKNLRLNIYSIENQIASFKTLDDTDQNKAAIEMKSIPKYIEFNQEDISEFEVITYNNIAEVPIQGKSKPLHQLLGVGESNFTLRLFYKNNEEIENESLLIRKIKQLQELASLEQRYLKIDCEFGILNALDLNGAQISDIHFSNDSESDGFMVSIIFKVSGYANNLRTNEINLYGEKVNETPYHRTKTEQPNNDLYIKRAESLTHIFNGLSVEDYEQIVFDRVASTKFTYTSLIDSYSTLNSQGVGYASLASTDIVGIKSVFGLLERSLEYIITEALTKNVSDGYWAQKITMRENLQKNFLDTKGKFYEYSLNVNNAFFPSDLANRDTFLINECMKALFQTYLSTIDASIFNLMESKSSLYGSIVINDISRAYPSKSSSEDYKKEMLKTSIKFAFNTLKEILHSERFLSDFRAIITLNNYALTNESEDLISSTYRENNSDVRKIINQVKNIFDDVALFEGEGLSGNFVDLMISQQSIIMNIRRQGFESYYDYFVRDREGDEDFYYSKTAALDLIDPIVLGLLSVFSYNYGINTTFFGSRALTFYSKFIDIGIEANSLFNSLSNDSTYTSTAPDSGTFDREKIKDNVQVKILDKIFGNDFSKESDLFYRPLTSNVALTDLGSYLGENASDFHDENRVLYKDLLDSLDYKNLSPVDIEGDLGNTTLNPFATLVSLYKSVTKEVASESTEKIIEGISDLIYDEKEDNDDEFSKEHMTEMIDGYITNSDVLFREFEDVNRNLNQNLTSSDFRLARFDSFTKSQENIKAFEELYSSDLLSCIPTYDVFVTRESSFMDLNTFAETLKIENFLGVDKLASMNIQFTEQVRGKTATFTFIDTTEDVREYGDIPLSHRLREFNDPSSDDPNNFVASKARNQLRVGDGIHIRMGYNNKNAPVFNGNVLSISEGKIKQVVCVSHVADLENETFNMSLRDGLGPIGAIASIFGSNKDHIVSSIDRSYKSRVSSYVNNHIIFDNITTINPAAGTGGNTNFSVAFRNGEDVSTFNMINSALANSINSLYHFTNQKGTRTNLALGLRNKANFISAIGRTVGEVFHYGNEESTSGIDAGIIANINNVDRDFVHYGMRPTNFKTIDPIESDRSGFTTSKTKSYDGNVIQVNDDYLILKGSSFVDAELKNENSGYKYADYDRKNVTLKDVLEDAEKRAPGAYYNILENGFRSSLFYGRSNYNLDLHDPIDTQSIYSSHKAKTFLKQLEINKVDNFSNFLKDGEIDIYSLFIALSDAVGIINPDSYIVNPETYSTQRRASGDSSTFEEKYNLEKASNVVYAVTGKNLISNKIVLNDEVCNKITMDFKRTVVQTVLDGAKLDWRGKTSLYSSTAFKSLGLNHRVREKVIVDPDIKQIEQAIEVAQSALQSEMEKTYDGRITILFNPNIRYRTELKIFDTVNQTYGSVLVRDFEHKFDSRGSYTIITPMLKVEQNLLINELSRKSFWSSVFHDDSESKRTRFAEELGRTSIFFNDPDTTGPSLNLSTLSEIIKQDISKIPLVVGDTIVKFNDQQTKGTEVLKLRDLNFMVTRALDLHPLSSRGSYLIPDEDVYLSETRSSQDILFSMISRYTNNVSSLFTKSYRQQTSLEENLAQWTIRSTLDRFSRLFRPNINLINEVSTASLLGNTKAKTGSVYGDVRELISSYNITNKYNIGSVKSKYVNQGSVGFWNVKVLMAHEYDRINKISDVISNFDVCGITELCGAALDGDKFINAESDRKPNAEKICKSIVERLNTVEINNAASDYKWFYKGPTLLRKNAQVVSGHGVSDEYGAIFYRQHVEPERRIFNILDHDNQVVTFPVEWDYIDTDTNIREILRDETNVSITLQSIIMEQGPMFSTSGLKKVPDRTQVSFFHNIYSKHRDKTYFGSPISRASGLRSLLDIMNSQNMLLLGDFNMTLYNGHVFKREPILGSTAALFNNSKKNPAFDETNLLRFKTPLIPLIGPQNKTTIGNYADSSAYDQVLSTNRTLIAGVFRDVIEQNSKTTRENISDHYPVFARCLS